MIFLKDLITEFEKYIVLKDPERVMKVVLGNLVSNVVVPGNPVWTTLIAPSSGGKTTLLAPLEFLNICFMLNDLTEKTLVSGYKVGGKEYSVLKLADRRVVIIPDFTTILTKNAQSKGEILGQLRQVYDGDFIKYTGTGKIVWKGKIGMLLGCTPSIYRELEGARAMGERFTYFNMQVPSDDEVADKIAEVRMSSLQITEAITPKYTGYFKDLYQWISDNKYVPVLNLTDDQTARIKFAAKFCVSAKATVSTDYKTGKVDSMPSKAGLGRDYNIFLQSLRGWQAMDAYELQDPKYQDVSEHAMFTIELFAYSSLSRERRKILEILSSTDDKLSASEIGARDGFGLEKESVEKYLAPLHAIGIIQKIPGKSGQANKWYIQDQKTRDFVKEISFYTKESGYMSEEQLKLLEEEGKDQGSLIDSSEWRKAEEDFNKKQKGEEVEDIWGNNIPFD